MTHASKRPLNPNARPWHPCRTPRARYSNFPYLTATLHQSICLNKNAPEFLPSSGFATCFDDPSYYSYECDEDDGIYPFSGYDTDSNLDDDDDDNDDSLFSGQSDDNKKPLTKWYYLIDTPNGPQRMSEEEYHKSRFHQHRQLSGEELVRYKLNGGDFVPVPTLQLEYSDGTEDMSPEFAELVPEWPVLVRAFEVGLNKFSVDWTRDFNASLEKSFNSGRDLVERMVHLRCFGEDNEYEIPVSDDSSLDSDGISCSPENECDTLFSDDDCSFEDDDTSCYTEPRWENTRWAQLWEANTG